MVQVYIPDSLPSDSQPSNSQRYNDYTFEATQLSQPHFSQTQNTQGTAFANSQVEPRRKYWATFIPTNAEHSILKIPWTKSSLQIGRGPHGLSGNDVVLVEKRISNRHCKVTLGIAVSGNSTIQRETVQSWKDGEGEPEVWIEDLGSSNGTFINGERIKTRQLLQHGDEVSLGHQSTLDTHDVRYIFRSVGGRGTKLGQNSSKGGLEKVGEVYERYQLLDRLGKGTFAEVHRAVDIETGSMRAVKQIVKHRFAGNAKTLALFQREIKICAALEHENICRLIEYFEDPQHICLVLEYVDGGDLLDYIMNWPGVNGAGLPEDHAADLTLQICQAMAYTHGQGVTHRDLKPENILLTKAPEGVIPTIKIADFGLAKMVDAKTMLTSMVGTPQYLAPEVVMQTKQNPGYENVVDSWSVGIIVYSMLTKALPFDEDANLPVDKRIRARFTQQFDTVLLHELQISQRAISFISRLLEKTPAARMSMVDALDHDWLIGSSSQHSNSSKPGLGGDSVWEIQSFDGESSSVQGEDEENFNSGGGWTRPATVSGTNMESAIGGVSDESFSQPMGALRLDGPGHRAAYPGNHHLPSPSEDQTSTVPSPSPPPIEVDPIAKPDQPEDKIDGKSPGSLLTPSPSEAPHTLKRKIDGNLAIGADPFGSGSLSPPPASDDENVGPGRNGADGEVTKNTVRRRTTRKIAANQKAETKPKNGLKGESTASPRRSTRPRKSIRLA